MSGQQWTIERWGNPVPGPNAGRDLSSLRVRFLQRLRSLGGYRELANPSRTLAAINELEREFAPILAEAPYRAVLAEAAARALARAGDLDAGIELLQQTWQEIPYDSLGCGLAHLQALNGDLNGAVATLERTIEQGQTPAGGFRAVNLLIRIAIEMRDQSRFATASGSLTVDASHARPVAVARANLWWDQVEPADCRLESLDVTPDAEAVACLARWRRGQVTEQDLEVMAGAMVRNPDAEDDVRLAQAVVLLALAREDEALAALEELIRRLERQARSDFMAMQTATLARAIEITTLVRSGRRDEASIRAEALGARLRRGLLPAILVSEALGKPARVAAGGGNE
jgi:tetratricopeptide (TPR) repeat protein